MLCGVLQGFIISLSLPTVGPKTQSLSGVEDVQLVRPALAIVAAKKEDLVTSTALAIV